MSDREAHSQAGAQPDHPRPRKTPRSEAMTGLSAPMPLRSQVSARIQHAISGGAGRPGSAVPGVASELDRQAIGLLRAVVLDAPDIDRLATFYEQFAGW